MQKTPFYSYKLNSLAKGCQLCVEGRKSVLFITGICPETCFYCPISDKKKNKDVIYINEWPTREWRNIIKEISLCQSEGVGITGGDPLARLERTILFIKKLKKHYGKDFHIHLYTPLTLVNKDTLKRLYEAGLDEIRFHPVLEDSKKSIWKRVFLAKNLNWQVGVEIPLIPGKDHITKGMIDYMAKSIDFLNLNELEYSDTNASHIAKKGFHTKDSISYAIKGSENMALSLLQYIEKGYPSLNVHYCTSTLKDRVQMRKRIMLRASSIRRPFDRISEDGTLIRGAIYLKELLPRINYRQRNNSLGQKKRKNIIKKLKELKSILKKDFSIDLLLDRNKLRLLASEQAVIFLKQKISPRLFKLAIVEEYPTYDEFEVEIDFL